MPPARGIPQDILERQGFSVSARFLAVVLALAGLLMPCDIHSESPEADVLVIISFTGPIEITDKGKKMVIKGGAQALELRIPKGAMVRVLDGEAVLKISKLVVMAGKGSVFEYADAPQRAGQVSLRTSPESANIKLTLDRTEMTLQSDSQLRLDLTEGHPMGAVCGRGRVTVVVPDGPARELGVGENYSFSFKEREPDQPILGQAPTPFVERPFINGERGWVYPLSFTGTPPQCPHTCMPGEILMKFVPTATQSQINEVMSVYGLRLLQWDKDINWYYFSADSVWFYRIIQLLQIHPLVQYAEPNFFDHALDPIELSVISPSSP